MRANVVYLSRQNRLSPFSELRSLGHMAAKEERKEEPSKEEKEGEPSKEEKGEEPSKDEEENKMEIEEEKEAPSSAALPDRSVLRRVLNFFQVKGEEKQIPSKPPTHKKLCCPEESAEDKENIPPQNMQSAMSLLQSIRQQDVQATKKTLVVPPLGVRRLEETEKDKKFTGLSLKTGGELCIQDSNGRAKLKPNLILRRSLRTSASENVFATKKHFIKFSEVLEDPMVLKFLTADVCRRYADKYLIAMVFTYFVRAKLQFHEFTLENFFAGLYLAHDMEEDDEELKYEIFPWALGRRWRKTYPTILQKRDNIFWAIGCRAVVSKKCCDQVMDLLAEHWVWKRERPEYHSGALRSYLRHDEDNGRPRGPDKSPLQCLLCLERQCMESKNSFLIYLSDSESSGETKTEKNSGIETFLNEKMETEEASSHNTASAGPEGSCKSDQTKDAQPVESECGSLFTRGHSERKNEPSENSSAYDLSIDSEEEIDCQENNQFSIADQQPVSLSQADTLIFSQVQSKLFQEV